MAVLLGDFGQNLCNSYWCKYFDLVDKEEDMKGVEDRLQIGCVRWFSLAYSRYARLLHHSPNGGSRNVVEAAKFKQMGVRAGYPDLSLLIPRQGYHALFIEMKTPKGRQSENQKEYQAELESQGYKYVICRSVQDFINEIEEYMK